jgi:TatD DNase family protein
VTGASFDGAAPSTWTDSHCHIQSMTATGEILARAGQMGVSRAVVVGTDETSSRQAVELARSFAQGDPVELWATVGLHPHEASRGLRPVGDLVEEMAEAAGGLAAQRVVAVGECGLDFHYDHSPRPEQRDVFAAQVRMAHRHGLALVIHTREAWDETFEILQSEGVPERCVFHCFSGGAAEAERCLSLGAVLSFSGIVTFPSAGELREAASRCPLQQMLVETDAPYLTPAPHRGKQNEPGYVPLVGETIARLKGVSSGEVAAATAANAAAVFSLPG